MGESESAVLWQGRTGADGQASCRHFQLVRPDAGDSRKERFAAMLAMPLPSPAVATFAGRPAQREPVRLQVPPHTRVLVQLTDHRGAPLLSPAAVALWTERGRDFALPFPVPGWLDRPRADKPAGDAPVVFPFVGSNTPVRAGARFAHERRGAVSESRWTTPDPEPLALPLPLAPELALLAGCVVGPGQRPFGPAAIAACVWRREGPVVQAAVHTLADGRFDLVQRPLPGAAELWLELRAELPGAAPPPAEIGARVHYQALQPGERRELGTIVLGDLPPLCSGVVVDDLGAPVADAQLKLQRREMPPNAPGRPPEAQRDPWQDLPLLATRSDADGLFSIGGELPRGDLRVLADTGRHFADSAPVRLPGQQVRIVLQRNGVLRGRVLLPEWIPDGSVTLTLRPFDPALRARDTKSIGLQRRGGGRFTLEPLRPGRYDAVVAVRNLPEPLCVLADLFVTPGETRDGRLRPLDLRQSLFRYRLRAVGPGGRPLPVDGPIVARLRRPDGGPAFAGFRWQRGRAELITGSSLAELVAFGARCEPTALTFGPGDHDVYLRQVQPALVAVPGVRALCGPTRRVRLSVVFTGDTGLPQWLQGQDQRTGEQFSFPRWELGQSNGAWIEQSETVEVPIVRSGKYEVVLRLHATDSERSPQASVPLGVHELRVDSGLLVPVTIPVDPQKVQKALDSLQRQVQRQQAQPQPRGNRSGGR